MLYQLLDPMTHSPLAADRTATFIGLNGQAEHFSTFAVAAGLKAHLAAGTRWPLDWTVDVPRRELHEPGRLARPGFARSNRVLPTFWEGAASATGTKRGSASSRSCIAEPARPPGPERLTIDRDPNCV